MKRYEFWCDQCGKKYYKQKPDIQSCSNLECKNRILELVSLVELSDTPPGVFGIDFFVTNRFPLDKSK